MKVVPVFSSLLFDPLCSCTVNNTKPKDSYDQQCVSKSAYNNIKKQSSVFSVLKGLVEKLVLMLFG